MGAYYFWREIGKRMGITGITASYEDFERYNREYERDKFRYDKMIRVKIIVQKHLILKPA